MKTIINREVAEAGAGVPAGGVGLQKLRLMRSSPATHRTCKEVTKSKWEKTNFITMAS